MSAGATLVVLVLIYFAPSLIALRRGHRQLGPIVVINAAFGWTLIGWVVSLAWSVSAINRPQAADDEPQVGWLFKAYMRDVEAKRRESSDDMPWCDRCLCYHADGEHHAASTALPA
jgi:Superinfection immunity protein